MRNTENRFEKWSDRDCLITANQQLVWLKDGQTIEDAIAQMCEVLRSIYNDHDLDLITAAMEKLFAHHAAAYVAYQRITGNPDPMDYAWADVLDAQDEAASADEVRALAHEYENKMWHPKDAHDLINANIDFLIDNNVVDTWEI